MLANITLPQSASCTDLRTLLTPLVGHAPVAQVINRMDRLRRAQGQAFFTAAQVIEFMREAVRNRSRLGFPHIGRDDAGAVVGFATLSASQVEPSSLSDQPDRPMPLPATLLGPLAIRQDQQGKGYGRALLLFALRAALGLSRDIGSAAVITQPVDERARGFYRRWGFQETPFDPHRSMILRMVDLECSGIGR